jgi:hypothetical protein
MLGQPFAVYAWFSKSKAGLFPGRPRLILKVVKFWAQMGSGVSLVTLSDTHAADDSQTIISAGISIQWEQPLTVLIIFKNPSFLMSNCMNATGTNSKLSLEN